jgi:predicted Holliday junction resolvase-like endonuclease
MKQTNYKAANDVIHSLNSSNFYCICPCGCGKEIKLKDVGLFYLNDFTEDGKGAYQALQNDLKKQRLNLIRKKELKSRHTQSVNFGFISEKIVTAMHNFPFAHKDCRSLFKPIDYIIFEGLSNNGSVSKIIFTEIKSGNASLNPHQREIKKLVGNKKVEFKIY